MKWLLLIAVVACSKSAAPAEKDHSPVPQLSAAEIQRSRDACTAYADRVCACTAPAAKQQCALAKGMPAAIELALGLMANPDSKRQDALAAEVNIRETVKECIEEIAKLPALGCP